MVGGHSNTFLYNGKEPSIEKSEETYPFIVNRKGQDIPVVTAYKYTKYLGYLKVQIQNDKLIPVDGSNPILMDKKYEQG